MLRADNHDFYHDSLKFRVILNKQAPYKLVRAV